MTPVHVAWLGLGSNLDQPQQHVRRASADLAGLPGVRVLATSALYRTAPVGGPPDQPQFCNACVAVACQLLPLTLLGQLQAIEADHGRVRDVRWGPRTLDLDMLAYDELCLRSERLCLPHPRVTQRAFVLVPLAEIAPALMLDGRRVIDHLARIGTAGVARWS